MKRGFCATTAAGDRESRNAPKQQQQWQQSMQMKMDLGLVGFSHAIVFSYINFTLKINDGKYLIK